MILNEACKQALAQPFGGLLFHAEFQEAARKGMAVHPNAVNLD